MTMLFTCSTCQKHFGSLRGLAHHVGRVHKGEKADKQTKAKVVNSAHAKAATEVIGTGNKVKGGTMEQDKKMERDNKELTFDFDKDLDREIGDKHIRFELFKIRRELDKLKEINERSRFEHPKPSEAFIKAYWEGCPECRDEWEKIKAKIRDEKVDTIDIPEKTETTKRFVWEDW